MLLDGHIKGNEISTTLYNGTMEECRDYADILDKEKFYSIYICKENGEIVERIKPYIVEYK